MATNSANDPTIPLADVSNVKKDVPSPYKRRKVDVSFFPVQKTGHKSSVYHKSRIPVRYSKTDHLNELKRQVSKKEEEINEVNRAVMTLRTKKHQFDSEGFELLDTQASLIGELNMILEQVEEIRQYESQALADLDVKLELAERKLRLEHEDQIEQEKVNVTSEVESLLEAYMKNFADKQQKLTEECEQLQKVIESHPQKTAKLLQEVEASAGERIAQTTAAMDESLHKCRQDLEAMREKKAQQIKELETLRNNQLSVAVAARDEARAKYESLKSEFEGKADMIDKLNEQVVATEMRVKDMEESISSKTHEINGKSEKIMMMKQSLLHNESERRQLHNRLQELKGNIRVYCRIRPPGSSNTQDLVSVVYPQDSNDINANLNQEITFSQCPTSDSTDILNQGPQSRRKASYTFQFDKVFTPEDKNEDIFEELSQMVQSALDGFNVCVFAYGQTGSGKTWTMSHPQTGMIPLTINKIFGDIEDLKQSGWDYTVKGQFLEIYNESIIDLLTTNPGDVKYEIKHDDINNRTSVTNLSSIPLTSSQQAVTVFEKSSSNRSTASTKSNERSSRSHSIFILNIEGTNSKTGQHSQGTLNLIDLAGSERLNNSQAKGERLKETQYINKSLSCLGDVIYSLGQSSKAGNHVPYRNSKLTYLLKNSLGGDSKTLMFVNISPLASNFGESINSFRFATKVAQTKQAQKS